jgi:hypothetical protein
MAAAVLGGGGLGVGWERARQAAFNEKGQKKKK